MTKYNAQSWKDASAAMETISAAFQSASSTAEQGSPLTATSLSPIDMEVHKGLYSTNIKLAEISRAVKSRADREVEMLKATGVAYDKCDKAACDIAERIWK